VVSFSDICFVSSLLVRSVVPCKLPQNLKLYSLQCVTDMAASATLSQCTVFNVTVSLARMVRGSTYTLMAPEVHLFDIASDWISDFSYFIVPQKGSGRRALST